MQYDDGEVISQCRLLVVCSDLLIDKVTVAIRREASDSAKISGAIQILGILWSRRSDSDYVTSLLLRACDGSPDPTDAVIVDDIAVRTSRLDHKIVFLRTSPKDVEAKLKSRLRQLGLDWRHEVTRVLEHSWLQHTVSRQDVDNWLDQFKKFGSYDWIGEGLLKTFDFWPGARFINAFGSLFNDLSSYDAICINGGMQEGKSASFISGLVTKRLDSIAPANKLKVRNLNEAIEDDAVQSILFLEDCSITGNELTRTLADLEGRETQFLSRKAMALSDPAKLKQKRIDIAHAVVTNWSVFSVPQYLSSEALANISLASHTPTLIETLTHEGMDALKRGDLLSDAGLLSSPNTQLTRPAFDVFPDAGLRARAMRFCSEVGHQLIRQYYLEKEIPKPDEWCVESALGVRSNGLALAFFHSIPKETLPLFWMSGRVESADGRVVNWNALLPFGK